MESVTNEPEALNEYNPESVDPLENIGEDITHREIKTEAPESLGEDISHNEIKTEAPKSLGEDKLNEAKEVNAEPLTDLPVTKAESSKGKKRVYRKKRTKDMKESDTDSGDTVDFKRIKVESKDNSDNVSVKSNGTRDSEGTAESTSTRSRRSNRASKPNHFYSNFELESGSGSESEKIKYVGVKVPDDEYTPVKDKKKESTSTKSSVTKTSKKKGTEGPSGKSDISDTEHLSVAGSNSSSINGKASKNLSASFDCADVQNTTEIEVPALSAIASPKSTLGNIVIASVSSIANKSIPSRTVSNAFNNIQSQTACHFMKEMLNCSANLGCLIESKSKEFVDKKVNQEFLTDTRKLQFCMDKAFTLFELTRNNLNKIEIKLKKQYIDFMVENGYNRILKCDKNTNEFLTKNKMSFNKMETQSCPEANNGSDSDCEIVEEASTSKKLPLDILRRVERNGVSWKAQRGSFSSEGSDGSQKIHIPGKSTIILNKDIKVKKVSSNQSFFREDGRTLKPPDIKRFYKSKRFLKQIEKRSLILGWLDLAYKQISSNFLEIITKCGRPKRDDSCSDLGDSCSDDDFDMLEDITKTAPPFSLLKLCIDKINNYLSSEREPVNILPSNNVDFNLFSDSHSVDNDLLRQDHEVEIGFRDFLKLENINPAFLKSIKQNKTTTTRPTKSLKKFNKALEDLLQSTTDSECEYLMRPRKKRLRKRIKKHKNNSVNKSNEYDVSDFDMLHKSTKSLSNLENDLDEDWSKYNHLKSDPKLYYKTSVQISPLSPETLKPFEEYLKEMDDDLEIERLIDFSTLVRKRSHHQSSNEDVLLSKSNVQRSKTKPKGLPQDNLFTLINGDGLNDDIVSQEEEECNQNESYHEFSQREGLLSDREEEPIEQLVQKFKVKNNLQAKNLLVVTTSDSEKSDLSDEDLFKKSAQLAAHPQSKHSDSNSLVPKQNNEQSVKCKKKEDKSLKDIVKHLDEKMTSDDNDSEDSLDSSSVNESRQSPVQEVKNKSSGTFLKQFEKALRKKRNKIILSDSEEEKKKWQRKRNRLLKKEQQKANDRSTDTSDIDTASTICSSSEEDEEIDAMVCDSETLDSNSHISTPHYTEQMSPSTIKSEDNLLQVTPRTKNNLAHTELLGESSEELSIYENTPIKSEVSNWENTPVKMEHSDESVTLETPSKGRRNIRKVLADESLTDATKIAAKEEEERLRRLNEKNIQLTEVNSLFSPRKSDPEHKRLVLDFDIETKEPLISVHPALVKILKSHQVEGVKFMWDTCFESVKMINEGQPGGGCILAHCMGLGKSLQVVALVHSLLTSKVLNFRTVLICCPLSTVLNWAEEFHKWLRRVSSTETIRVFELSKFKKHYERGFHLHDWHKSGGVFIMGYEMFRLLTNLKEDKARPHILNKIQTTLLNPGPDIVVCDEGHLLKNNSTTLAKVMNKINTRRRIVLTGTPLQNNLKEYYCMVNFVKPNLLGSRREYFNRFENPILNGQHRDSSSQDISVMKKRSHVLHKMLEGCVQRKEVSILYKYLPRKQEFVLLTTMSECQAKIYKHYMDNFARANSSKGASLLKDFHTLQKVWTHPRTLQKFLQKSKENKPKPKSERVFFKLESKVDVDGVICLDDDIDIEENMIATDDVNWWTQYVDEEALEKLETSPKFYIAFKLLDESIQLGEKMLIFCTSLFTLDAIEYFLKKQKGWDLGEQYFRLDGSVSLENRQKWCRHFNSEKNTEAKLFLISTRAGGLGINMIAANRVVIMDVSWNPSHDIQSIFRVYRFGQKKDCYIYRLVALGTMEEKIYERSVTKQAVSCRVVDEQQIDRHYNMTELSELYTFNPVPTGSQPVPRVPSDEVLAAVLATSMIHEQRGENEEAAVNAPKAALPPVWSMHEHDSLLRDLHEEQLDDEERRSAWLEYEAERTQQKLHVKSSAESILPDKINQPMWSIRPMRPSKPVGPVFPLGPRPRYMVPRYYRPPNLLGFSEGTSILPDQSQSNFSGFWTQPIPYQTNKSVQLKKGYIPERMKNYNLGSYQKPRNTIIESELKILPNVFQNVRIGNVHSTVHTNNGPDNTHQKQSQKPVTRNSINNVINLTSVQDSSVKINNTKSKRKLSSKKKSRSRTPKRTPKKTSLPNKQKDYAKRLNFDEQTSGNTQDPLFINIPEPPVQDSDSPVVIELD